MGKKKKKDKVVNPKYALTKEEKQTIQNMIFIDAPSKDLLDSDYFIHPEHIANVIKNRIKNGATAYDIAYYDYDILTAILTYFRVPGRSKFTTKQDKAIALVKYLGGKKWQYKDW